MRISQFFLSTSKEAPAEAELVSHKLMLRAGLIKRLGSGLYTWMPLGLRVLRKVEAIVREEMNRAGAVELLMPAVQPAELWQETGRWEIFGPQMLKIRDRHERDFCFGPTHEEVITDLARRDLRSYKQLPMNFYQIQTKFRDEIRPRFGVMRAREFVMKDAYSFHIDEASLDATYQVMYDTYSRIFTRLGLKFRAVAADTGAIGGSGSHEFHVLADSGEDAIAFCPASEYAANVEMAEALAPSVPRPEPTQAMVKVATPGKHSIEDVTSFLGVPAEQVVKTLIIKGHEGLVALLVRGDHQLNEVKAAKLTEAFSPLAFATDAEIRTALGCAPGSIGPVGLNLPIIADRALMSMADVVCGANENGFHLRGVNIGRDMPEPVYADLRDVLPGDPSPDGKGHLDICRGIEVGHIFKLGAKYSRPMNAQVLDEQGAARIMLMGCYGIGVSRVVAAAIEQYNDERGIVFPQAIAPFELALVPLGYHRNPSVREVADNLYKEMVASGIEAVLDDRDERPGVMFADMELVGIPHRIVVSERGLKEDMVEYQGRRAAASERLLQADAAGLIVERVRACR